MTTALPRWDLGSLAPAVGSRDWSARREALTADLGRLEALYQGRGVRGGDRLDCGPDEVAAVEEVLDDTNRVLDSVRVLSAYLSGLVTTDAADQAAAKAQASLQAELAALQRLSTRLDAWLARFDPDDLAAASDTGAGHRHAVVTAAVTAAHQMTEAEEGLYADLRVTGATAWSRLHGEVTAVLTGTVAGEELPIEAVRGLSSHPDPTRRRAAWEAEMVAWESVSVPLAAALNAIKGETQLINDRRGWADPVTPSLHANGVSRAALDAMQEAAVNSFPDFRRYLRAKAALVGPSPGTAGPLAWWDLSAPVGGAAAVQWDDAVTAVEQAFDRYGPELADLARRALGEGWVDAGPRAGKRGGAYCMSVGGDASRVLLNFDSSAGGVQTLAHELGHAFHNTALAGRTAIQRRLPMALAETASIFCETLLAEASLAGASPDQRLALLDVDLAGSCQVVVDIHSRFLFESAVFDQRRAGTLSASELSELMLEAQASTYADGIVPDSRHRYMWAVKPHYYSTSFYNWPYTFGLLFGLGLHARYREDPERFRRDYADLLSSTGLAPAAELAGRFGIDVESPAFWASSLDVIRVRIDEFERLAATVRSIPPGV